ncbi:MAG: hypothetical protein UV76_C0002G0014 [Candidatus Nomurabacteria bacterium GW2011_GWA2_43_15]|uniref:Uncharacterized protein n=2 Tax=Candidatus Nomuraibacteriota TaxID=1752729 RepID=A0A0G1DTA1_9BACT|nr:MAG: hypothetical protein UV76_C0002G0014 [Candidatus Nomurabacteria bacterium GW2011_GWA2_43_15]KKT19708.1 MAG: hypothetical protein UW02_C0006G0014 [Candidatus Nomurabacteria bacterium GW2011_GWB1_43_7]
MKIKIPKIKKSFRKGGFHTNPNISWEIVLCLALALILASFVSGFYLFTQVSRESFLPIADSDKQVPMVDENRLEKVLDYFSERENKSAGILNSPIPVVDPSL